MRVLCVWKYSVVTNALSSIIKCKGNSVIRLSKIILIFLCLSLTSISVGAEQEWQINLKNADINAFIGQVADITGKSFVIDPRVKGRVNVLSSEPLNKAGVYELFLSVLQVHGYAAVPAGDVTLVVQQNEVKQQGRDLTIKAKKTSQEMLTKVIIIKNTPALDLVPILRPLVARYGHLAGVRSVNALIISDHASNIRRIEQIIQKLDKSGNEELEVIQLKEAWVGDVVKMLQSLDPNNVSQGNRSNNRGNTAGSLRVVADERSNRLIIKGEKSARQKIRTLIESLDEPSYFSGTTKVIRLQYASAKNLAKMLSGLSAETPTAANKKNQAKAKTGVYADEELNALVIRAEPSMLREMEELVSSLDVPRAQVLIESAIVEVSGDIDDALGVQWGSADIDKPVGGTNFSLAGPSLTSVATAVATKNPAGAVGNGLSIGAIKQKNGNPEFGVLLQALEANTNTNLLSTPSIMTIDNQEAEIVVGQNVPFRTGSTASSSNSNPFITIKRQDVGITLKVVPHIHDGQEIRLEVTAKQESVAKTTVAGSADLITNKRALKTTVMATHKSTIVLGGLIRDDVREVENKVPILGDIPLLGWLFRSKTISHKKSNLMVFLRPSIVKDKASAEDMAHKKFNGIWDFTVSGELLPEDVPKKIDSLYNGVPIGR